MGPALGRGSDPDSGKSQDSVTTALGELLRTAAEEQPEKGFHYLSGEGRVSLTYPDLWERAAQVAQTLQRELEPGARVLVLCGSGLDFITNFWGCLLAGVVAVPAPAPHPARRQRTENRLRKIVEDCRPTRVLGGSLGRDGVPATESSRAKDVAVIQYTSGSTRDPRGVILSPGNLVHNLEMLAEFLGRPKSMVMVHWLPLYHDMGLIRCMMSPLHLRPTATLWSRWISCNGRGGGWKP